jgi:hypothetical protein
MARPTPIRSFMNKGYVMKMFYRAIPLLFVAGAASAVPVDLTSLTTAVDFSTTTTAVLAVAAALIGVYIAWKAAKLVISAVRGG